MAEFVITLEDGEELTYNTNPATLVRQDGTKVDLSRFAYKYVDDAKFENQIAFSKDVPVVGKVQPRILKIQLGLGCNYSCSYCSQGGQKEEATSTQDAENFSLDWVIGFPDKVELWGGEPLLYWKKIQSLTPKVRARFGNVTMSIVSNGTLLTKERIDWLYDNGFRIALSHDGPGQHLRGEDPLQDKAMADLWRYVFEKFGERASINSVLTAHNHDLFKLWMWFEERLGEGVRVNVEDIVTDYGGAKMSDAQLHEVYLSIRKHASTGLAMVFPRMRWAMLQFMETLAVEKPLAGSNQVCGMDRRDQLAVDLHGNVLTCQNAGAQEHTIGNVSDLGAVKLNTSTSYQHRPNCSQCPVVHLCYGSCMFLEDKDFESSCRSSYWYNKAVMEGVIKLLTGKEVRTITGWKPTPAKRVIPIKVTT